MGDSNYFGKFCEECPSCTGTKCDELSSCVECRVFGTDISESECELKCGKHRINITEDFDTNVINANEKLCYYPDNSGCTFVFKYIYDDNNELEIIVQRRKKCSVQVNILGKIYRKMTNYVSN